MSATDDEPRVERTPDEVFDGLPGYPFSPRWLELGGAGGLRTHHLDEGVREHPVVLMLHGLPGWSFGFRHAIPILVEAGCRVVAPDLVGCGKSDKPSVPAACGYAAQLDRLSSLVTALDLRDVTLVCEDVGALLGLRLVADLPERFGRVVALSPCLPTGGPLPPTPARWAELARRAAFPPPSELVRSLARTPLSPQVAAGYDAPFRGTSTAALIGLGALFEDPAVAEIDRQVLAHLGRYLGPLVLAVAESDAATRAAAEEIAAAAPGARWLEGPALAAGARLIAEDRGPELAAAILELIRAGLG